MTDLQNVGETLVPLKGFCVRREAFDVDGVRVGFIDSPHVYVESQ